jgi:hypothetical protein
MPNCSALFKNQQGEPGSSVEFIVGMGDFWNKIQFLITIG